MVEIFLNGWFKRSVPNRVLHFLLLDKGIVHGIASCYVFLASLSE